MYKSKLAQIIDEAVLECIHFGAGSSYDGDYDILADWATNGKDINVCIMQHEVILFNFVEKEVTKNV